MGDQSGIQWTDATWNPIRGCSRVSEGCRNCYAERVAARFSGEGMPFERVSGGKHWTGVVEFVEDKLADPLRWKKPRRIFVNSMSDLFHEKAPDEWLDRIFAVMALTQRHTYQILTKRPERMRAYLTHSKHQQRVVNWMDRILGPAALIGENGTDADGVSTFPCPAIHLGVSVENQAAADERIPLLLQTPAAVRFLSVEPLLEPVGLPVIHAFGGRTWEGPRLDWVIVGGESGPGARPCDLAWIRSVVAQCKAAGTACFVKQLGAHTVNSADDLGPWPVSPATRLRWNDRKGGDMSEWPEDLRVREFPRG